MRPKSDGGPDGRMTYAETLAHISKMGRFGMKLGTERTRALLDALGGIDRGLHGALIAGTNGKGPTGECLASILLAEGRAVGFMPKPHLISYTERIQLDGVPISEADFVSEFQKLRPVLDDVAARLGPATEFEMLTVLAVAYLAHVDLLVCEVGLGGRLDATNALDLGVAVITNVDLDHQKYLGDTIEQIAREKAAIIKPGNRVITGCEGVALAIVEEHAAKAGARLWRLSQEINVESRSRGWEGHVLSVSGPGFEHSDLELALVGEYQPANAALAVATAHALGDISDGAIRRGLKAARWPGRLQVVAEHPRGVLDGGHNPAALTKAGGSLRSLLGRERRVRVFGMLSERDPNQLLAALRTMAPEAAIFTEPASAAGQVGKGSGPRAIYWPGGAGAPGSGTGLPARARVGAPDGS